MFRLVFFYSFCFLLAMGPGNGFSQTIVNPRYLADNKQPEYPTMSLRLGEIGTVVLRIVVTKTGTVGGVEVKSSSAFRRLDDAAVFAARNWKFEPALKNGVAVEKEIEMPVTFKLPQGVVATAEPGNGGFIWPTDGKVIRSFDASRKGIDIAGQPGQPIVAVGEGTVLYANNMRGFGNLVIIDHRDGLVSAYGHNKVILVKEGQTVAKGQRIAEMGDSDAESVRLHFEIRQLGKVVDPMGFLPRRSATTQSSLSPQLESGRTEQSQNKSRINLVVSNSQPDIDGKFEISIKTNADTASLKINSEELGGREDGIYTVKKFARAGQDTLFTIIAKDINGNTETRTITVSRAIAESSLKFVDLDPSRVRARPTTDSVAIIIGIQNYKRLPRAEFANSDASSFYDYAIRALGIRPENIKMLLDEQADEVEILTAFRNWLPIKVKKGKTDVHVFYSGHGLPSDDGKSLYILPYGTDRNFIDRTALNQQEIIAAIQSVSPRTVTMFMDACYSGQIRTGDTLLASARPIALNTSASTFPPEFTVFTASSPDQIASSSPDLKHGIFSYYVMKGMEGDADENKDGRITAGELQNYLSEMVSRQAMVQNRKQQPQLIGDGGKLVVSK